MLSEYFSFSICLKEECLGNYLLVNSLITIFIFDVCKDSDIAFFSSDSLMFIIIQWNSITIRFELLLSFGSDTVCTMLDLKRQCDEKLKDVAVNCFANYSQKYLLRILSSRVFDKGIKHFKNCWGNYHKDWYNGNNGGNPEI